MLDAYRQVEALVDRDGALAVDFWIDKHLLTSTSQRWEGIRVRAFIDPGSNQPSGTLVVMLAWIFGNEKLPVTDGSRRSPCVCRSRVRCAAGGGSTGGCTIVVFPWMASTRLSALAVRGGRVVEFTEVGAFWLELAHNYFAPSYVNELWTAARREPWPPGGGYLGRRRRSCSLEAGRQTTTGRTSSTGGNGPTTAMEPPRCQRGEPRPVEP
ncbi:MAG: hypothetical protein ACYC66_12070 [Chloroflexota bacterium]